MTTTEAIAFRIQASTLKDGRVGLDPLTILAIVQALATLLQGCYVQPENALAYLRCDDLRHQPIRRAARQWLIDRKIKGACVRAKIRDKYHRATIATAVLAEFDTLTVDQIADLFADISR